MAHDTKVGARASRARTNQNGRVGHSTLPDLALDQVRQIYRELDARPIERNCRLRAECCHFKLTGKTPHLTRGEALLAARALKTTGRKSLPARDDGACPLLDPQTSRCLIYADRPFGCRTHFCAAAGGPYTRREVIDLIRRLEEIDQELGGNGSRAFAGAMAEALYSQTGR